MPAGPSREAQVAARLMAGGVGADARNDEVYDASMALGFGDPSTAFCDRVRREIAIKVRRPKWGRA